MMEDCNNKNCHKCPISNIVSDRLIDGPLISWAVISPGSYSLVIRFGVILFKSHYKELFLSVLLQK